jgi:hypothetical protein
MKPEELKIIIEQMIEGHFNSLWFIVALTSLISAGIGSFIGTYMKKKAENLATKEDFKQILEQVAEQVRTTENIKAEISSSQALAIEQIRHETSNHYWKIQEWKKIRMERLENLVGYIYELAALVAGELNKTLEINNKKSDENVSDKQILLPLKIQMLSRLYFNNELHSDAITLTKSYAKLHIKIRKPYELHHMKEQNEDVTHLYNIFILDTEKILDKAQKTLDDIVEQ